MKYLYIYQYIDRNSIYRYCKRSSKYRNINSPISILLTRITRENTNENQEENLAI